MIKKIDPLVFTKLIRNVFLNAPILDKVPGFLSSVEGSILFSYASSELKGEVVEIGSFKGKSTCWLASALKLSGSKKKVYAIDPHIGSEEHQPGKKYANTFSKTTLHECQNNLKALGLEGNVEIIQKTSMDAARRWKKKVGLIFIDGSHSYDDVRNDFMKWSKFVPVGGVIILHDTEKWPGPKAVVEEFIDGNTKYLSYKIHSMTVAVRIK